MPFGNVLKRLRTQNNLTQKQLADVLGISESTVGMYERGHREPAFEMLEAIADYFNVDMDYLTGRTDVERKYTFSPSVSLPDNIISMPKMKTIPLLGVIACGEPILANENLDGNVAMPEHVVADFALRCKGDSMIDARIFDGDIVYIRQQPTVNNGEIAAVLIGDEATLKRVYLSFGQIVLSPANSSYQPFVYSGERMNEIRILGKAVAFTSTIKEG